MVVFTKLKHILRPQQTPALITTPPARKKMSSREIRAAIRQAKAEAAQEISSLREALSDLQAELTLRCARYCTQRDNVLADLTERTKERDTAQSELATAKAAYENCAKDRARYRTERDDAQAELKESRAVKQAAKLAKDRAKTNMAIMKANHTKALTELKKRMSTDHAKAIDTLKKENRQLTAQIRKRKRDEDSRSTEQLLEAALKKLRQNYSEWRTNIPREFSDPMWCIKWKQYGIQWRQERGTGNVQYVVRRLTKQGKPLMCASAHDVKREVARAEQRARDSSE